MILEGIVTTTAADGSMHVAPMGPIVDEARARLVLRPFQTSTTYQYLARSREGVFHITDDVELLAAAAVGRLDPLPPATPAMAVRGWVLDDACRWFAFRVVGVDDSQPRAEMVAEVVDRGRIRDFCGFNRARHAVVEAAILATRTAFVSSDEIRREFERCAVLIDKTGGDAERRALALLDQHVRAQSALLESTP